MRYFQTLLVLVILGFTANAQQLNSSSLYDMYGTLHNPAVAGANKYASIGVSYRKQWESMPGSPETALVFGNTYLPKAKLGVGGYIYSDKTGPTKRTGAQLAISYHIPFKKGGNLSFGFEGRGQQFTYDKVKLQQYLGNDPVVAGSENRFKFDAGFGVAFTMNNFQIGASVAQLLQSQLDLYEGTGTPTQQARLYRHYYFHANYTHTLDEMTKITPNVLYIYLPNAPKEFQGGLRVEHNNLFWYGLTWRARQSWMISAGLKLKQRFNIGYSFDIYKTPLSTYDGGSYGHEIMLRYDFIK
jgi:type IX secretion system PorP/SprF family membrane protein